jgi:hypothetical protein
MPEPLKSTFDRAYEIDCDELPGQAKTWIAEHPYQTAFYIVNGVAFFFPSLMTGPLLWSLGWTSNGPRAGRYPHSATLRGAFKCSKPTDFTNRICSSCSHGEARFCSKWKRVCLPSKLCNEWLWDRIGARDSTCWASGQRSFKLSGLVVEQSDAERSG